MFEKFLDVQTLPPCPFCNRQPDFFIDRSVTAEFDFRVLASATIEIRHACSKEPLRMWLVIEGTTREEVAEAWSRRCGPEALLLYEYRRGLLDMKRRGLLGIEHCPDDDQWIDKMLSRTRAILKGKRNHEHTS